MDPDTNWANIQDPDTNSTSLDPQHCLSSNQFIKKKMKKQQYALSRAVNGPGFDPRPQTSGLEVRL